MKSPTAYAKKMKLKYLISPLLRVAGRMARAVAPPGPGFRIVLLHHIPPACDRGVAALIDYLDANHGIISPHQARRWLSGESVPEIDRARNPGPFLITFDDGFASNLDFAKSVFTPRNIKALFFVNPGHVGLGLADQRHAIATNIMNGAIGPDDVDPALRIMTWEQLAELKQLGHEIGCHGLSHQKLSGLETSALETEIDTAGDILDAALNQKTDWFAYAFGDIDSISPEALSIISRRFKYCRSGIRGANDRGTLPNALRADSLQPQSPDGYQKMLIGGGVDFLYRQPRKRLDELSLAVEQHV